MKKTIYIFLAIPMVYGVLTSFVASGDEKTEATIVVVEVLEAEVAEIDKVDHYADYLQELNSVGPKESEVSTYAPTTNNTPVVTKSKTDLEVTVVKTKVEEGNEIEKVQEEVMVATVNHAPFGALLKKHVDAKGNVNYEGFKADEAKLDTYLEVLRNNPTTKSMGKNERLAYWINVYNAFTIKLILENYPVSSIKDINDGKPWDKQFITLGSTTYSLNMVENEVIRKRFTEPRIHFAVNCAAASCPPLLNDAFYADKITNQLAERTKSFMTNSKYNTITSSKLQVSKIFDWYGTDFGNPKNFINDNTEQDVRELTLEFKEYDWTLNKQ